MQKKWPPVINNAIYYPLFVLTTSVLLFFIFILIFQINYCRGDFLIFQTADRFSNKDNEVQWTAYVSLYVRETSRLKDPGVLPIMAYTGTAAGGFRSKGVPFMWKMVYKRVRDLGEEPSRIKMYWVPPWVKDASSVTSHVCTNQLFNWCRYELSYPALCCEWIGGDFARLLAACSFIQCIFFIITIFSFPVFCFVRHFRFSFSSKYFYCDILDLYNIMIPIIKLIQ